MKNRIGIWWSHQGFQAAIRALVFADEFLFARTARCQKRELRIESPVHQDEVSVRVGLRKGRQFIDRVGPDADASLFDERLQIARVDGELGTDEGGGASREKKALRRLCQGAGNWMIRSLG